MCEKEKMSENFQLYRDRDRIIVDLDALMKYSNDVLAGNRTRRCQIEALRKERTLYDSIFKDLESQIKKEEESLLKILELSRSNEIALKENSEYLKSMNGVLERSNSGSLKEMISEQKALYEDLTKSIDPIKFHVSNLNMHVSTSMKDVGHPIKRKSILRKFIANSRNKQPPKKTGILETIKQYQRMEKERKIAELERLFLQVKSKSEESDFPKLSSEFKNVAEDNEKLYQEYMELENEVG
jgi:hypothetical protein